MMICVCEVYFDPNIATEDVATLRKVVIFMGAEAIMPFLFFS